MRQNHELQNNDSVTHDSVTTIPESSAAQEMGKTDPCEFIQAAVGAVEPR